MRRSEINEYLRKAKEFFASMNFNLPPWGHWSPDEWKARKDACGRILRQKLGWDVTDFGGGPFLERGLLLFALRNGEPGDTIRPYAEKIMIVREGQETPFHFHWNKTEDIINRGGGRLVIELYRSTGDEEFSSEPVTVSVDGIDRTVEAGGTLVLEPGESITLVPYLYHRFFGEPGHGLVLTGEVSKVNDDDHDNRFATPLGRYPEIEEDEEPLHLLVSDYDRYLGAPA
ncbi:MAG: D-lyxose/D-mannose family sugar isomerase [Spirochaetota bacterium]